jgi:hypothetical protein
VPSDVEQTRLWGKSTTGWTWVPTAATRLDPTNTACQIANYVTGNIWCCIHEENSPAVLKLILEEQALLAESPLLRQALCLWTANRLLVKGWEAHEAEIVIDMTSPYFWRRPAPRVLQNELDVRLEFYVAELESSLLRQLDRAMIQLKKYTWNELYCTCLLVLAIMERDTWRLVYWVRHKEEVPE